MATPPLLFSISNEPVIFPLEHWNTAFDTSANLTISLEDISLTNTTWSAIQGSVVNSIKATVGNVVINDPTLDIFEPDISNFQKETVIQSILDTISAGTIQTVGGYLISNHSRPGTSPFVDGDTLFFPFTVQPGRLDLIVRILPETRDGAKFFSHTIAGQEVLIKDGSELIDNEWLFTQNHQTGPYISGEYSTGYNIELAILLYQAPNYDFSYNVDWAIQPTTINNAFGQNQTAIIRDSTNNAYVAFHSSWTSTANSRNIVIAKIDPSGTILWNTVSNTNFNDAINGTNLTSSTLREELPHLAMTTDDRLYLAYKTNQTLSGDDATGGFDVRLAEINVSNGNVIWTYRTDAINSSGNENVPYIEQSRDLSGILLTHTVRGNTTSVPGVYQGTSTDHDDVITCRFTLDGTLEWVKHYTNQNSSALETYSTLAQDLQGNIYLAYHTLGNISGLDNSGSFDIIISKMDASGELLWVKRPLAFNTSVADVVPIIRYCEFDNTLYLGVYTQTPFNVTISKLNTDGDVIWANNGDMNDSNGVNANVVNQQLDIAVNDIGAVFFTYAAAASTVSQYDIIFGALNPSGDRIFLLNFTELQSKSGATHLTDTIPHMVINSDKSVYLTYEASGAITGQSSSGSTDIVVARLNYTAN